MTPLQKCITIIIAISNLHIPSSYADCYAHTIFVPRQLTYNPVYEDALIFNNYAHMDDRVLFSFKPIYTKTTGKSIKEYFNINHKCSMNVQEDGSGDIDSLWFQVISTPGTYYASTLSFSPIEKTYGAMLYFALMLPADFALTINTAVIKRKNSMHICERISGSGDLGQDPGFSTLSQAFTSTSMCYGKICGTQSKSGADDIQIKLLKNFKIGDDESIFADVYALVGIPTGNGSKAVYLFEPMVGSKHAQCGLGLNAEKTWQMHHIDQLSLYGELKWHYGFKATETRSFDMTPNGQWSRYLLFTTPASPADPFFAINDLTFQAQVTPRSSFDLLLAAHAERKEWSFELGYNFWYRQTERVCPCINLPKVGIADLVGIAQLANASPITVTTASSATIWQGVQVNQYQMAHDASYTLVTAENIDGASGAQAASCTNAIFGSIGYRYHQVDFGINASYEGAANSNSVSIVSVWADIDVRF